jgi:hypothetical protein
MRSASARTPNPATTTEAGMVMPALNDRLLKDSVSEAA